MSRLCRLLMCVVTGWCSLLEPELRAADPLDQWTIRPAPFPLTLFDVIYGKGLFVAIGRDFDAGLPRLLVSPDGSNWTRRVTGSGMMMQSVAYGNGMFVAVGTVDSDCCRIPGVVVSTNGLDWKFWPDVVSGGFSAITYGNGQFVAAGDGGQIARSTNGTTWVTAGSATPLNLQGIAYGNGLFVATVSSTDAGPGEIERSADAINWTSLRPFNAFRVFFGRNIFLAAKAYPPQFNLPDPVQISSDAINWTAAKVDTNDLPRDFAYAGGIFVAAGTRGLIETSMDGTNWVRRASGVGANFRGIAYGAGTFVAVGDVIIQSGDLRPRLRFEACCPEIGHRYHLLLSGRSNSVAQIQSSTDLINWQPGASFLLTGSEMEVLQSNAPGLRQFYRAELMP